MDSNKISEDVERMFYQKFLGKGKTPNRAGDLVESFLIIDKEKARQFLADELVKTKIEIKITTKKLKKIESLIKIYIDDDLINLISHNSI